MPISSSEHRLLYRIAQAYYLDHLTQQQIAQRFGLSRPKVSRLLHRAREEEIVKITLKPPTGNAVQWERAIEDVYHLDEVVLVSVNDPNHAYEVARELGNVAADYVMRYVQGDEVIAIAWGRTIMAMVDALPHEPHPNLTVVQMTGGLGPLETLEHATELARRMASKLDAKLRLLPTPGIVSSRSAAEALRSDVHIAEALHIAATADIAMVGLGVPSGDSVLVQTGQIISQEDLTALANAGAVGDIALHYIDADGQPVLIDMNERIIGLSLAQIHHIDHVIGVGGGTAKLEMIRATLRSGILDVLITDDTTAAYLVKEGHLLTV